MEVDKEEENQRLFSLTHKNAYFEASAIGLWRNADRVVRC